MTDVPFLSRRAFLAAGIATITGARASTTIRVAALGWAGAQTLMALGVAPVAMPEIDRYNRLVVEPPAPPGIQELGLRPEPNLELLTRLAPDLIITELGSKVKRSLLEKIASVESFEPTRAGYPAIEVARGATLALASRVGKSEYAASYLDEFDARLTVAAGRLDAYRGGPLCLVSDIVGNRALVYGANSIYQDVLDKVGIRNAFTGATSVWGHATIGLEAFAAMPSQTRLVLLSARIPNLQALLAVRPLFRAVPMIREDRVTILSDILFFGGLPSADRFARLLASGLPLDRDARG